MLFQFNYIEIIDAYLNGSFPTLNKNNLFFLYKPTVRPVLFLNDLHVQKNVARKIRNDHFQIKVNADFKSIMKACVRDKNNWITPELIHVYSYLHKIRLAHSVEVYRGNRLVGGLYGLALCGAFFVESMFSLESDTSKIALSYLVDLLKEQNFLFVDFQISSAHLFSLGAKEIIESDFDELLDSACALETSWGKSLNFLRDLTLFNIESSRTIISSISYSDENQITKFAENLEMYRYTLFNPPKNKDDFKIYLNKAMSSNLKGVPDSLAIRLKDSPELIGCLSVFYPIRELPTLEVAIEIEPKFWRNGYAKEVINRTVDFCFDAYSVYRVQARCVVQNEASNRLFLSTGFAFEGTLKNSYYFNGSLFDLNFYAKTRKQLGL